MDALLKFMASPRRNAWIACGPVEVYIRKANRYIEGRMVKTLDLANIQVEEKKRSQGYFRAFIANVELLNRSDWGVEYIYVESILEPRLIPFLSANGYTLHEGTEPPALYRKLR